VNLRKTYAVLSLVAAGVALAGALPARLTAAASDIPLRQTIESRNGQIQWHPADGTITIQLPGGDATIKAGTTAATVQGKALALTAAPYLVGSSTWVSAKTLEQIEAAIRSNPLLFAFSSVGDSRIDAKTPNLSQQDYVWLNNSKVVNRMEKEVVAQKASMFFFNGDMIMGYTPNSDANVLNRQYAFWRGMVSGYYENGVYVFPVPGNHEVQDVITTPEGKTKKVATQANENTWRNNMSDVVIDQTRTKQILGEQVTWDPNNFPKAGSDHITTDQSKLNYSFDYKGTHFVVINTDPAGNDSHAPVAWLKQDLDDARTRGLKHSFVFGHKMAYTYKYDATVTPGGLDADPAAADAFWQVIQDHNATYFCGHEHIFNVSQPKGGKAYQVIVGSGGSPFESDKPTGVASDRMYAWATTKVYADGRVRIDAYGFDDQYGPTQHITGFDLEQGF
jgi:hypothetical protein